MKYFNSGVKCQFINPDTQTLLMFEPEVSLNIFEWVKENRYLLEEYLIKYNGVLLRNFCIYSVYPADRTIPLHNENSYTKSWPNKIFFFSVIVASEGGETPIASSRNVYRRIDNSIKERFKKNGIMYVRNYIPGVDLSW